VSLSLQIEEMKRLINGEDLTLWNIKTHAVWKYHHEYNQTKEASFLGIVEVISRVFLPWQEEIQSLFESLSVFGRIFGIGVQDLFQE